MHGLVIKSPYIEDILDGIKTLELRGQNTKIRGTIVLLKSGSGLALGTVDIVDVKELSLEEYNNWDYRIRNNKPKVENLPYKRTYAYQLSNPIKFGTPKKYIHPMGAITWVNLPENFLNDGKKFREPEKAIFTNMCMIEDSKGNVLVQRRVKGWNGLVFPGGHVERFETITDSTIREIKEETGLDIWNLKLCGIKQWFNDKEGRNICFCFKTSNYKGKIVSSNEGEIFWMPLDELKKSNEVAPNFDIMLRLFIEETSNEMICPLDGKLEYIL